jgi:transcriptional regulator with XRE-family HTH domain
MISKSTYTAELIRFHRRQKKLSQKELSAMLSFSTKHGQFVSNVESGKCQLPVKKIHLLSKALGIPIDQIIKSMTLDYELNTYKQIKTTINRDLQDQDKKLDISPELFNEF